MFIAATLGVGTGTVQRIKAEMRTVNVPPKAPPSSGARLGPTGHARCGASVFKMRESVATQKHGCAPGLCARCRSIPGARGRGIALIVVRLLELAHKLLGEGLLGRFPPQNSGRLNWRPFFIHVPLGVLAMLRPAGDDSHA
jgi:hypothetical protein